MPEDQIREILKSLDILTKALYKLEAAVENSKDTEDIKELKSRVIKLEEKHSRDIAKLFDLMREHDKENHSSKNLSQVLINFGTMAGTIGAMYLMMKG